MSGIYAQEALATGHLVAASDLDAAQYKFVKLDGNGQVVVCTATTDNTIGVLVNKPKAGQPCAIQAIAVTTVVAGAANIAAGDPIYLKADGTVTEVTTSTRVGTALEAATNGTLFTALVITGIAPVGTV